MVRLKRPDQYIREYYDYWLPGSLGLLFGGAYSIPSLSVTYGNLMLYGDKPDTKKTVSSVSGMAIGIAYDIWARQTGKSTTLGAARSGIFRLASTAAASKIKLGSNIPTNTAAIRAFGKSGLYGAGAAVAVSAWANLTYPNVTITHGPYGSVHVMPGLGYMGGQF